MPSKISKMGPVQARYCQAIFSLSRTNGKPPISAQLAGYLKTAPSTVFLTLKRLQRDGLVEQDPATKHISLTETGEKFVLTLLRRQNLIAQWLMVALNYSQEAAFEEAARMKLSISPGVEKALSNYLAQRVLPFTGVSSDLSPLLALLII